VGADSMQVRMGAGTARGDMDRGAGRQKDGVYRFFIPGTYCPSQSRTKTLGAVISSACCCAPQFSLCYPRRWCRGSGQLSSPTWDIWKFTFGSWGFGVFSSFSLGLKKPSCELQSSTPFLF